MTMRQAAGGAGNLDDREVEHREGDALPGVARPDADGQPGTPPTRPIGGVVGALAGGAIGTASVDDEALDEANETAHQPTMPERNP